VEILAEFLKRTFFADHNKYPPKRSS